MIGRDDLKGYIDKKLEKLKKKNPERYNSLIDYLNEWKSEISESCGLCDLLKSQIEYQADRKGVSAKEFVDYLFSKPHRRRWILEELLR